MQEKTLMISLDERILDPGSAVLNRMQRYAEDGGLVILIPSKKHWCVHIGEVLQVEGTGGWKIVQFFRLVRRTRLVLASGGIGTLTAQDPFFTGLAGLLARTHLFGGRAGKKVRFEVQLHGDFFGSDYYKTSGVKHWIQYHVGKCVIRLADTIRVVGERVRQGAVAMGVAPGKISVRPIAVNAEAIRAHTPQVNLHQMHPQYEKIFLALSRLDPVKNIPWLLDVFAAVLKDRPRYGLVIVGGGRDKGLIEDRIEHLGLARAVQMKPWTKDPWSYLKTADALLFPSLSEGYGLVVMEAIAAGTPVVMTDVGVANYEVQPRPGKVTIVPVGDAAAFKDAIISLKS